MNIRKAMSVSMPLEPPFKPGAFITPIILVIHTEALDTACEVRIRLNHHVEVILRHFMENVRHGRRGWRMRLPWHTLWCMHANICIWLYNLQEYQIKLSELWKCAKGTKKPSATTWSRSFSAEHRRWNHQSTATCPGTNSSSHSCFKTKIGYLFDNLLLSSE